MPEVDKFLPALQLPKSHRPSGPPERVVMCILCRDVQTVDKMRRAKDVVRGRERGYVCDDCAQRRHELGMLP